jgi:hypothetical protein
MRASLLLLLLLFSSGAAAKCGAKLYVFSGSVEDASGTPLPNALVAVSWIETSVPNGPAMALTDELGMYSIPIRFDTFSGYSFFSGDKCKGRLTLVSVMAYTSTHHSQPDLIDVSTSHQVAVPPLRVKYEIHFEPIWGDEVGG